MKLLCSVAIALILWTPAALRAQSELTLIAPQSVQASLEQLVAAFESKTGRKVKTSFVTGGVASQQVARGEAFDVAVLQPPIPEVLASGNVAANSEKPLASIAFALLVRKGAPKPDISTADAVKRALLASKGIAYPGEEGAVIGIVCLDMLKKLGIYEQMQPKLKPGPNLPASTKFVVSGEADYGFTLMRAQATPDLVPIGPLPKEIAPPMTYVGLRSAHAKDPAGGVALLDYISSPEAASAWTSRGFQTGP